MEIGDRRLVSYYKYPKVTKFEDLIVWQKSLELSIRVHKVLRDEKNFSLRDQMQRASISIASNIAEGYERNTNKDYIRFLFIAKGSCSELRTQLYLAKEITLLDKSVINSLIEDTNNVSALLHNYIRTRYEKFS
jgi:four helix bundle protein